MDRERVLRMQALSTFSYRNLCCVVVPGQSIQMAYTWHTEGWQPITGGVFLRNPAGRLRVRKSILFTFHKVSNVMNTCIHETRSLEIKNSHRAQNGFWMFENHTPGNFF